MKRILIILAVIVVLLGGAWWILGDQFSGEKPRISVADRAAVRLMPLPASMELSGKAFSLGNGLRVQLEGYPDERIQKAVDRMMDVLGVDDLENSPQTLQIICVEAMPDPLPVKVDESYSLSVAASRITLIGNTPVGVLHGLETLIQLATEGDNGLYIPGLELNDEPRFPWRGMMIDVSRHWIPKEIILRQLDALAAVKMNVFHWHLSDDQGFRVESKVWPLLHEVGSNGDYYTQEEIKEVVSYAYDRGIRVVPEFDVPGHATAIIAAYPELGSGKGEKVNVSTNFGIHVEVMNPTSQKTYAFLDGLVEEMAGLFPDPYFHIGGDEVNSSHWDENPAIQSFMKGKELEDAEALQAYFNKEIQAILKKHGKKMVGWDEILHPELPKDIVAQVWRDHTSLLEAALGGNQGILSAGYYLDYKLPASFHYDVDPLKVKGGITIEPDSIWRHWDLELNVRGTTMESEITLFGQGEELRGVVNTMGNYTTMENPSLENNQLNFQLTTQFGTATFEGEIKEDSLVGQMSLSIIALEAQGLETGSSDIEGSSPPELKRVPELTEEAKARILGGETCMWLEVADQTNLESRLWPRSAAIAEKFWSPEELTGDVEDMYRRMYLMSQYLDLMGLDHLKFSDRILEGIVGSDNIQLLQELVSVLEEAKYYERHSQTMMGQLTSTPLYNLVDATYPESEVARQFSLKVDVFLADSLHETHKASLREQLVQWKENQKELQELIPSFTRDQENIMTHSQNLELVSEVGILLIDAISNHTDLSDEQKESWQIILNGAIGGKGGIILPIAPAVQKLLTAS
ncbi:MAG: family 20 glycosylhydrolase [Bacteroidota bacterium]